MAALNEEWASSETKFFTFLPGINSGIVVSIECPLGMVQMDPLGQILRLRVVAIDWGGGYFLQFSLE